MNKFSIILFCAIAVLVTGCAKDVPAGPAGGDDWVHDMTLPVPVEFGKPVMDGDVRSAIRNLNDMHDRYFGFFAVDKNSDDLRADDGLRMCNQNTRYDVNDGFRFGYPGEKRKIYYPENSDAAFDFYAYYSFTKNDNVEVLPVDVSATRITVGMPMARSYDVLYGYSTTGDGNDGYSAEYLRKTGDKPVMRLSHPAAALSFDIVTDESSVPVPDNDTLMLASITLKNVPDSVSLCIVDRDDPSENGKFTVLRRSDKKLIKYNTGNLNASFYVNVPGDGLPGVPDTVERDLGDDFFIAPQEEPIMAEAVFVHLSRYIWPDTGESVRSEYTTVQTDIVLDPAEFGFEGGYKAGYMYNYRIVVAYLPDEVTGELVPSLRVEADR